MFDDELHRPRAMAALISGEVDGFEQDGVSLLDSGRRHGC